MPQWEFHRCGCATNSVAEVLAIFQWSNEALDFPSTFKGVTGMYLEFHIRQVIVRQIQTVEGYCQMRKLKTTKKLVPIVNNWKLRSYCYFMINMMNKIVADKCRKMMSETLDA